MNREQVYKHILSKTTDTNILYETRYNLYELNIDPLIVYQNFNNKKYLFENNTFNEIRDKLYAIDNFLEKPFEYSEGSETCQKCGSQKTISYNKQCRSSDEGMTVFVQCIICKHRSVMSS